MLGIGDGQAGHNPIKGPVNELRQAGAEVPGHKVNPPGGRSLQARLQPGDGLGVDGVAI